MNIYDELVATAEERHGPVAAGRVRAGILQYGDTYFGARIHTDKCRKCGSERIGTFNGGRDRAKTYDEYGAEVETDCIIIYTECFACGDFQVYNFLLQDSFLFTHALQLVDAHRGAK